MKEVGGSTRGAFTQNLNKGIGRKKKKKKKRVLWEMKIDVGYFRI